MPAFLPSAHVELLDDFAPAYQKPAACPYAQAVEDAQIRLANAARSGDKEAEKVAAIRLQKATQQAGDHLRARMRQQWEQLTHDEKMLHLDSQPYPAHLI